MTDLREYEDPHFWASTGWIAPWLLEVDRAYWPDMVECIGEHWFRRSDWREHILTEAGQRSLRMQLCTRMSQASDVFVPWLGQAIDVKGLRILELGCGSGSSTAGLAKRGAIVSGVDIKGPSLIMARRRLSLLGLQANFVNAEPQWLQSNIDEAGFPGPYDLIVCYAMLEHLLIPERLNLLKLCRSIMRRDGSMLATFETPNRFAPFDWHSSKLPFADVLPDELTYRYARKLSPRRDHPAFRHGEFSEAAREAMYRFGRGVSWHEFELAIGFERLQVVLDGYSPRSIKQTGSQNVRDFALNEPYETALAAIFSTLKPPIPRGFCRPSLELLLRLG